MDEATNNVIAQFAIENANLKLMVEQLRLENLRLEEQLAQLEEDKEEKGDAKYK